MCGNKRKLWQRISIQFRKKRMADFEAFYVDKFGGGIVDTRDIAVLDLGGTLQYWQSLNFEYADTARITLLNLRKVEIPAGYDRFTSVVGDATDLSEYGDKQFDLVFSNSVIEHVGDFEAQKRMASEIHRTGKHYYLQTPNRYFFLEPHTFFPLFQFLPVRTKAFLHRHFRLGNMAKAGSDEAALEEAKSIRLLTEKELQALFPEAKIKKEKFLFMTKSFCLYSN